MSGTWIQIISTIAVALGNFSFGYMSVWPSYAIPIFQSSESPLNGNITSYHQNLLGSTPMLGCFIGTMLSGVVGDAIGRKKGLILCSLIYNIGWTVICNTRNINVIIASRITLGFSCGLYTGISTMYMGETSSASIRGTLMSVLMSFGYIFGVLMSYIIGWLCSYYTGNYIILSVNVVFTLSVIALKETPLYLLRNGREQEALASLKFYRQVSESNQDLHKELAEIKSLLQTSQQSSLQDKGQHIDPENQILHETAAELPSTRMKTGNPWKLLFSSATSLRAVFVVCLLAVMEVSSGMICIETYAGPMFTKATPNLSPHLISVLLALANIAGSWVPVFLSDIAGRRILMVTSCTLISLCLATLGALLTWPIAPEWMVPTVVLLYCFCYQSGAGTIPIILNSECYLPEVKSICILMAFCSMWIFNFIALAIYQTCLYSFGINGTFFMYSIIAGSTAVVSFLIVPETTGKSIAEIQKLFENGLLQVSRSKTYKNTKNIME